MLGGRAIGAIIGIISACSLFFLFVACCIVYYRRYLTRKAHTYVTAAQADDERNNEQIDTEQPRTTNRTTNYIASNYFILFSTKCENIIYLDVFMFCLLFPFLFSICIDGKGFGGGRGGGGFKGGSRGGGSFGGSKGAGTFGGSSSYNRGNSYGSYNSMNKPRSGSSFKQNAMSFGAGALGGVAAYSLMRSMSSSYHSRPGYYEPGYGGGETCVNNEDLNGTRFGQFRCPLNGFPYEARSCCGDYGKQYCCIPEGTSRVMRGSSNFGWILLLIIVVLIGVFLFVRHRRQNQKDVVMVPMEPPPDERQGPPFYQPAPPPMGYPSPPPQAGNPYAVPPQNYGGNFNPYPQQQAMPYPQQQQMPYHPYQVKEGGPPAYDEAMYNNQGAHTTKPI